MQMLPEFSAQSWDGQPLGHGDVRAMAPVLLILLRGLY